MQRIYLPNMVNKYCIIVCFIPKLYVFEFLRVKFIWPRQVKSVLPSPLLVTYSNAHHLPRWDTSHNGNLRSLWSHPGGMSQKENGGKDRSEREIPKPQQYE
jgi:hypothetical protein